MYGILSLKFKWSAYHHTHCHAHYLYYMVVYKGKFARLLQGYHEASWRYQHLIELWTYYQWTLDGIIFKHLGVLFTCKAVALCTHCYTFLEIHSWDVYITLKRFTKLRIQAQELLCRSTFLKPSRRLTTSSLSFFFTNFRTLQYNNVVHPYLYIYSLYLLLFPWQLLFHYFSLVNKNYFLLHITQVLMPCPLCLLRPRRVVMLSMISCMPTAITVPVSMVTEPKDREKKLWGTSKQGRHPFWWPLLWVLQVYMYIYMFSECHILAYVHVDECIYITCTCTVTVILICRKVLSGEHYCW